MATIGSLVVRIGADVGDLERGLGGAQERLASFGREMQGLGTGMMLGLTAPLAGVGVAALRSAGEFEQAMAVTQQVLGATAAEMGAMEAAALAMGAESVFSAGEVAAGMQELAKAGMDAAGVMDAMPGVVALAAAAGTDLGTAAAYTAATLNAFGLEASEANRVADLLAATANASAADMTDLAQGLQQGGFAFAAAGQGVDDLAASLAVLTNVGLTGSDAGTALKNAMIRLMSPTKEAATLMEGLGIEVYDAAGNMLAFPDILGELNGGLAGMTQAQRNAALETIFLSDGMKAMIPLLDVGVDGFLRMREAVNEQGAASAVAAARMSGLTGAVEYLRGSVDSFLIGAAQPYLAFLAEGLRQAGDLVTAFGEMDAATRNGALAFAAVLAAAGPAIFAVGTLAGALAFLVSPLGLVVAASAVLAGAWAADFGGMRERTGEAVAAVVAFGERVAAVGQEVAAVGQEVAAGVGTWATGVGAEMAAGVAAGLRENLGQALAVAEVWAAELRRKVGEGGELVAQVEAALAVKWGEIWIDGAGLVARVGEALGALRWGEVRLDWGGLVARVGEAWREAMEWVGLRLDWGPLVARVGEAWREAMATVGASLEGFGELGPAQQFRRVMEVVTAGLTLYGDLRVAAIEAAGKTVAELATGLAELATAELGQVDGQAVAASVTRVVEGYARELEAAFAPESMEGLGQAVGTLAGTIVTKLGEVLGSPGFGQDVGAAVGQGTRAFLEGALALAAGVAGELAKVDFGALIENMQSFTSNFVAAAAAEIAKGDYGPMVMAIITGLGAALGSVLRANPLSLFNLADQATEGMTMGGGRPVTRFEDAFGSGPTWEKLGEQMQALGGELYAGFAGLWPPGMPEWLTTLEWPKWTWLEDFFAGLRIEIPMPSWLGGWFDRASAVEARISGFFDRVSDGGGGGGGGWTPGPGGDDLGYDPDQPNIVFPAGMAGAGMAELAGAGMGEAAIHVHLDGVVIRSDEDLAALAYRLGQYLKGRV